MGKAATSLIWPTFASRRLEVVVAIIYVTVFAVVALNLPRVASSEGATGLIVAIGILSIWRYGWWGVHVVRSTIFLEHKFPRLRARADAVATHERAEEVYVLITSYRIPPDLSMRVYLGLIDTAASYGAPTKIVASVTDQSDVDMLQHALQLRGNPRNIEIRWMFQKGDGKRSAMAEALRTIARELPSPESIVVLMDGDIYLPQETFERSFSFFAADPELGALTTDNRGTVRGDGWAREWYDLRYAQRHLVMSSMSLSDRLLVLTGRFSVFRASVACRREFIEHVERDQIDHWRFGRFRFLSGDDKSTWFWLLKNRWRMLYVPDVVAWGFEELPDRRRFFASSIGLMRRWYGNMLRNNGRAVALGPRPMGFFTWWSLIDQRISMWTSLTGPIVAALLTVAHNRPFFLGYICWIMMTRVFATLILGIQRGRVCALWPVLLYYNQIVGALVKTWVTFRVNQQRWTRQNITSGEPTEPFRRWRQRQVGHLLHVTQFSAYVYMLALMTGVLALPDGRVFSLAGGGVVRPAADDYWLRRSIESLEPGQWLQLPSGRFELASTADLTTRGEGIRGAGENRTVIIVTGRLACAGNADCFRDIRVEERSPPEELLESPNSANEDRS